MAVSKVVVNTENGSETLIDLTSDTITDDAVFQGITFHSADGGVKTGKFTIEEEITEQDSLIAQIKAALHGKAAGGGGSEPVIQPIEITENGTYIAPDGTDGYSPITVQVESGGGDAIGILDGTATEINNSQVTSIGAHCCRNRDALIKVNLPNVTTLGASAFYQCPNLSEVHIPNLTTLSSTNIFNGTAVTEINFPKLTTATIPGNTFTGCAQLRKADLGSKVKGISANAFNGCTVLEAVILRYVGTLGSLTTSAFTGTPIASGTGFLYVPASMVETYKSATNWKTFADQFRAIEDYPDVCG